MSSVYDSKCSFSYLGQQLVMLIMLSENSNTMLACLAATLPSAVLLCTMPWVWTHAAIEVSWYQGEQLMLLGEIVGNDLTFALIRLDMALADNYSSGAGSLEQIGLFLLSLIRVWFGTPSHYHFPPVATNFPLHRFRLPCFIFWTCSKLVQAPNSSCI